MDRHTLFISDLHLDSKQPETTTHFEAFLQERAVNAEALYILGDLFELWIGDDDEVKFNFAIKQQLRRLAHYLPIYIMHGNRDFLLGERFMQDTGCQLLTDPCVIELYGRQVLLTHGDFLCTEDRLHQIFRRLTSSKVVRRMCHWPPVSWRRRLAARLRRVSRRHHQKIPSSALDVTSKAVSNYIQRYRPDIMIHGHTHIPGVHQHTEIDIEVQRFVMGAWHDQGEIVVFDKHEGPTLQPLKALPKIQ